MTRLVKSILIGFVTLILCAAAAVAGGSVWYSLWWNSHWIPTPPFCRFVLPSRVIGYHVIHAEMIFWIFTISIGVGIVMVRWLTKRRTMRSTEPPPRASVSMRRDSRTLDSLPAPVSGGGR